MSNLRLLSQTEITSSATSFSFPDMFSTEYNMYKIVVNNLTGNVSGTNNALTYVRAINEAGTIISDSQYNYASEYMKGNSSFTEIKSASASYINAFFPGVSNNANTGAVIYVYNPCISQYTFFQGENISVIQTGGGDETIRNASFIALLKNTAIIKGLHFYDSGTDEIDSGTIKVYGFRVDT